MATCQTCGGSGSAPEPLVLEPEAVPVPITVNMARMMIVLGAAYLKERAPDKLPIRDLTEEQITNVCCGILPSEHGAETYDLAIADAVLRAAGVRKDPA
jgi:hypothetical protein